MFRLCPTLLALGLAFCTPIAAHHAPADTARHVQLSAASIVAQRNPAQLYVAPTQFLAGAELRRLSAMTLADALRHWAGVQMKDYGGLGGLKTIDVRAMGTQHTAVTIDGVAIGTAQNGIVDLGRFSTDQMESLALTHGAMSLRGQSATQRAAAQVLHLHTRQPQWQAQERRHIEGRGRVASFATYNASLRWEERLTSSLSLTTQIEGLHTSGRYPFTYRTRAADGTLAHDTTALRDNSDVRWWRNEMALQSNRLRLHAYLYTSERGLPGAVVRGKFVHADRQWDTNAFLQGAWQQHWGAYALHLRGKVSHDHLRYRSDPSRDAGTMYVDHRYGQSQAYLSAVHSYTYENMGVEMATDYTLAHVRGNAAQFPQPTRHTLLNALSLSWTHLGWQAQGSVVHTLARDHTIDATPSATLSQLSPTLGLAYRRGAWGWRAYWKRSLRLPTLSDLYYTLVGNAALKPERATQYNLGGTWQQGTWSIEADFYRNRVSDKIVAVPTSNQFRWTMQNLGQVDMWGVDVKASKSFALPRNVGLHLRGNYSYLRALDITSPTTPYYRHQIAYAPRHAASAIVRLTHQKSWLTYSFIYTGARYDQQTNTAANYAPPWYTSDLAIGHALQLIGRPLQMQLEVSNLLDQRYEVVKGYPMPGIAFRLSVSIKI